MRNSVKAKPFSSGFFLLAGIVELRPLGNASKSEPRTAEAEIHVLSKALR